MTNRETEVLKHVANGMMSKEIAFQLGISERTVEEHRRRLRKKLGVKNVAEMTRVAMRLGVVT